MGKFKRTGTQGELINKHSLHFYCTPSPPGKQNQRGKTAMLFLPVISVSLVPVSSSPSPLFHLYMAVFCVVSYNFLSSASFSLGYLQLSEQSCKPLSFPFLPLSPPPFSPIHTPCYKKPSFVFLSQSPSAQSYSLAMWFCLHQGKPSDVRLKWSFLQLQSKLLQCWHNPDKLDEILC